jgi:hypothetical protein
VHFNRSHRPSGIPPGCFKEIDDFRPLSVHGHGPRPEHVTGAASESFPEI